MTQKVQMVSLSSHKYGREHLSKGDPFEAHPRDVPVLKALSRAKEREDEAPTAKKAPETKPQTSTQQKPQAQRGNRPAAKQGSGQSKPQQSRRQYNRRDMKAKR